MTYSPARLLDERAVWRQETGLPAVSLGIQHFAPDGGGYHEGNDLLAQAGRLNTDYSKRQSDRDRPGTDGASAIDIGYFDVWVTQVNGILRRVTLRDYNTWLITQMRANTPDVSFVRELIYSPDGQVVKREDRLHASTTGDSSHLTHSHRSDFRDDEQADKSAHVKRFWREMRGQTGGSGMAGYIDDPGHSNRLLERVDAIRLMATKVKSMSTGVDVEDNLLAQHLIAMDTKLVSLTSAFTIARDAEAARDALLHTTIGQLVTALGDLSSGGTSIDTAAIINAVNTKASEIIEATRQQELEAAQAAVDALES